MYNWEKQFELIRQGVAFVRATTSSNGAEPFDVVVRMRMVRIRNKTAPRLAPSLSLCPLGKHAAHRMRHACHVSGRAARCPSAAFASHNPRWRCDGDGLLGRSRPRSLHCLSA